MMHRVHLCGTTGARLSYIYFPEKMEVYVAPHPTPHPHPPPILEYPKSMQLLRIEW